MKALSIQQPWAWLIVNGWKDVENRTWRTNHRGETLIHAGKKIDRDASHRILNGIHPATGGDLDPEIVRAFTLAAKAGQVKTGGIVGIATFGDCGVWPNSPWFVGPFGFKVSKARTLPFRPLKGALGFFNVEMDPIQP